VESIAAAPAAIRVTLMTIEPVAEIRTPRAVRIGGGQMRPPRNGSEPWTRLSRSSYNDDEALLMIEPLHALYSRHAAGLRRYLARMVGPADAEDLVHDVFERAQRAAAPEAQSNRSGWLYRIARNAAVDRLRGRVIAEREDVVAALGDGAGDACEPRPDTELARAQMGACVLDLVERLSPTHRAVVLLSELRGLTDLETAEALGIGLGAAKIRLHRARRALRDLMERECRTYRDERNELACEPVGSARLRVLS
jgi:RNA polymerase sigma-70 factor (ECF subfamily)